MKNLWVDALVRIHIINELALSHRSASHDGGFFTVTWIEYHPRRHHLERGVKKDTETSFIVIALLFIGVPILPFVDARF